MVCWFCDVVGLLLLHLALCWLQQHVHDLPAGSYSNLQACLLFMSLPSACSRSAACTYTRCHWLGTFLPNLVAAPRLRGAQPLAPHCLFFNMSVLMLGRFCGVPAEQAAMR